MIEYNGSLGPYVDWVMPYNEKHLWGGKTKGSYFGASLKAYERIGKELGYSLVGTNLTGVNAFFVRSDILDENLFPGEYTSEYHFKKPLYFMGKQLGHQRNIEILNSLINEEQ